MTGSTFNFKNVKVSCGKPCGQTASRSSIFFDGFPFSKFLQTVQFKPFISKEGIVLGGYLFGNHDFDSLTGHPGIKY